MSEINYLGILEYLKSNRELPYADPGKSGLTKEQKEEYLAVKKNGQDMVAELKKIYELCSSKYGLNKCEKVFWNDDSHQKICKYLCLPMKYGDKVDRHESISVFVEMITQDNPVFRVSLELRNDQAKAEDVKKYHTHLDLPINTDAGLVYVSGNNELGRPYKLTESQDVIKQKVENKEYDKVQICKYISADDYPTNEDIEAGILGAVEALLPYYEYVVGDVSEKGVWLLTWNPDNWNWEDYAEVCDSTKKGETTVIPWTCANKNPEIGDEVFLIKTGKQPRGIIAHGHVAKTAYNAPHYDPEKAADGIMPRHIDVKYDRIQHYENEKMLSQDDLKEKFPQQQWSPMKSGIKIKSECVPGLRKMWRDLTGQGKYFPSYEQNPVDLTKKGGEDEMENVGFDKNMILYGPPGTGKTYNTAIYAVAICKGMDVDKLKEVPYADVMAEYDKLKKAGRIAFTTFHQSYGYEEFIEGIKPIVDENASSLGYTIESGVFKKFCEKAEMPEQKDIQFTGTVWNIRNRGGDSDVHFDYEEYLYTEGVVLVEDIEDMKRQCNFLANMAQGDMVVLGRNFKIAAVGIVTDETPEKIDKAPFYWQRKVEWIATGLNKTFSDIGMAGSCFSNFAVARSKIKVQNLAGIINQKPDAKPYVFIIDEINRGNISKIFGELITLIEGTKRKGMAEAASAILPYSGTEFSVPANVYIIGTMNTADRSIALMDTALRRRFQFIEMMPDVEVLKNIGAGMVGDLDVAAMLETINERITFLYDREHTIGHAFFIKLAANPSLKVLRSIFEESVIPLLQEYFYEDYQKIQLVLGDNGKKSDDTKFILDKQLQVDKIFKGNVDDIVDLPEKKYSINKDAFKKIESYKQIM